MNYCTKCGSRNDLTANFCNKCGKTLKEMAASKPIQRPEPQEDEDGDGVSLDYVPKINQIEVESIEVDVVPSISLGALMQERLLEQGKK